jgi:signal transduction histidine kinase
LITVSPCVLTIFMLAVGGYMEQEPMSALLFLTVVAIISCHFLVNSAAVFAQALVTICLMSLLYVNNSPSVSWEYIGCYSFLAAIVLMMSALSTKAHQEDIQSRMLFTSTISHELRTPLTGIIGNLELLLDTDLNDHQKDCGTVALYSSERMLELLNEFLDYAKI